MMETVNHESGNNYSRRRTSDHWRRRDWDNDPGHNERRLWMGVGIILLGLVLLGKQFTFSQL